MTNEEIIKLLSQYPPDMEIRVEHRASMGDGEPIGAILIEHIKPKEYIRICRIAGVKMTNLPKKK